MSDLEQRLTEDRMLRDAALQLFKADLGLIRTDLAERSVGERVAARLGEGTMEMVDEVADYAEANRGKIAAGIAAVVLWFGRGPILDALSRLLEDDEQESAEEPRKPAGRSRKD